MAKKRRSRRQKWRRSTLYRHWRKGVMARGKNTCIACGRISSHNHAHHIECASYNLELRYNVTNGVVLCRKCHMMLHTLYKKSYRSKVSRADLDDFLKIAHAYLLLPASDLTVDLKV